VTAANPVAAIGTAGRPRGRLVVLFDRDCSLCQATARQLRRWDRRGRLEMLSLQDAAVSPRAIVAATARRFPLLDELHVLDERSGRVDAGGDAALVIAAALPGGAVVRPLRHFPPARWIVSVLYRLVARHRHAIGEWLGLEGPDCDVRR
jgi:predicted DCC family thiol-disulfide oxidoreductase YuxK